ncbi:hypothetical protein IOD16_14705 [Saccharothrix sp. 6-C]|nr:hypothetical protein [Saccharothrix sp. 6-C]QQQ79535.1 hypothetical protein IOD16_14705 [Saccharothrix sp. 6-C]
MVDGLPGVPSGVLPPPPGGLLCSANQTATARKANSDQETRHQVDAREHAVVDPVEHVRAHDLDAIGESRVGDLARGQVARRGADVDADAAQRLVPTTQPDQPSGVTAAEVGDAGEVDPGRHGVLDRPHDRAVDLSRSGRDAPFVPPHPAAEGDASGRQPGQVVQQRPVPADAPGEVAAFVDEPTPSCGQRRDAVDQV